MAVDRATGRASRTVVRRMALNNSKRRAATKCWLDEQRKRNIQALLGAF